MAEEEKKGNFWITVPESSKQSEHSSASTTESAARQQNPHESTVVITAQDGTVTSVYADSFKHRQYSRELVLQNGQHIPFDKIKMLEVVRLYEDHAKVQITLLNVARTLCILKYYKQGRKPGVLGSD